MPTRHTELGQNHADPERLEITSPGARASLENLERTLTLEEQLEQLNRRYALGQITRNERALLWEQAKMGVDDSEETSELVTSLEQNRLELSQITVGNSPTDEATLQKLERLQRLRQQGALSPEEFATVKADLIGGSRSGPSLGGEPTSVSTIPPSVSPALPPNRPRNLWGLPTWLWVMGGTITPLVIVVAAAIASDDEPAPEPPYQATNTFGSLRITVHGPKLSGETLTVSLTIENTESSDRYDYDVNASFTVNFAARGKVFPTVVDGIGVGTLAPNESRKLRLIYTVARGNCPNNLHFEAIKQSGSSGDIALKNVGC